MIARASAAAVVLALLAQPIAGCGDGDSAPARATPSPEGRGAPQAPGSDRPAQALAAIRRFVAAANEGDLERVLAVADPDVRFDSVGRIFEGHDGIREFIGGEVIALGGEYRELSARTQGDRGVVEYDFRTGGGGRERFTYACRARQGLLTDCIGRYV